MNWSRDFYSAQLRGVLLNTVTELPSGAGSIGGAIFKQIVGHEPVTARKIRHDPISFRPVARHVFACNTLPLIRDPDASTSGV